MSVGASGPEGGPPRDPGTQTVKAVVVTAIAIALALIVLFHAKGNGAASAATGSTSHKTGTTTTTIGVTGPTTTATTLPPVTPANVRLQVLNGVGSGNYSTQWSNKLRANPGYDTLAPNDATHTVASSQIYIITAGYLPEAKALAAAVKLPVSAIVTATPPPSTAPIPANDLSAADLVLVIGPDLEATAATPAGSTSSTTAAHTTTSS